MNEEELKEAIEKSNIKTEAKAELIEIVESAEQSYKTIEKILEQIIAWIILTKRYQ